MGVNSSCESCGAEFDRESVMIQVSSDYLLCPECQRKIRHKNYSGLKIWRWRIGDRDKSKDRVSYMCLCECGTERSVVISEILKGRSKSCGCFGLEKVIKHGDYKIRLYGIWESMKYRCLKDKPKNSRYCGRGISFCEDWNNYVNFKEWALNNGYNDSLTLDRIETDGNYEPNNCRWIPQADQLRNMSTNVMLTYQGKTQILSQWARDLNIKSNTLVVRIQKELPEDEIFAPKKEVKYDRDSFKKSEKLKLVWNSIMDRCYNDKNSYNGYKEKGIVVCEDWLDFNNFKFWATSNGYSEHLVLSRSNLSKGFSPDNCNWITKEEFSRSKLKKVTYNGETLTYSEWAKKLGISYVGFSNRLKSGLPEDKVFTYGKINQ